MPFVPASKISPYERRVMEAPDYYTAVAFRGRAVYDKARRDEFEDILAAAEALYEDRYVAIYAVRGGDTAMIGYWRP